MHSAGDLVMCLGDFNGHMGRHINVFDLVRSEYGIMKFRRKNVVAVLPGEIFCC